MKTKRLISFSQTMYKKLKRRAVKLNISVSELVRRVLDAADSRGEL